MDIGKRITQLRNMKGYTINKLAYESGLSQSFISDIEHGKKKPTIETLSYICDALTISLKDFFDDDCNSITSKELYVEILKLNETQQKAIINLIHSFHKT